MSQLFSLLRDRAAFRLKLILEALAGVPQPIPACARNRRRRLPPLVVELALALKQPSVAALDPGDDLLGIELMPRLGLRLTADVAI